MAKTIVQTVSFKAGPEVLYALYANSKKHSAALGSKAMISSSVGGDCSAYDGTLTGKTLGRRSGACLRAELARRGLDARSA